MVVTKVTHSKIFDKQLSRIPYFIQNKVMLWVYRVETLGISEVMKQKSYHDEPLKGSRHGQRSVRMNRAYRIIYRVIENRIHIELLEVHKHDY